MYKKFLTLFTCWGLALLIAMGTYTYFNNSKMPKTIKINSVFVK